MTKQVSDLHVSTLKSFGKFIVPCMLIVGSIHVIMALIEGTDITKATRTAVMGLIVAVLIYFILKLTSK